MTTITSLPELLEYFVQSEEHVFDNGWTTYTIRNEYIMAFHHNDDGEEWMDDDLIDTIYVNDMDKSVLLDNDYRLFNYRDITIINKITNLPVR